MLTVMRSCLVLIGLSLCARLVHAEAALSAGDWPQFRGPGGQAVSTDKSVPLTWGRDQNVVWKTALPGAGTSSPIIVGDRMVLACYSGFNEPGKGGGDMEQLRRHLLLLRRDNGKVVWTREIPSKLPEQARIRDDHGYVSSTPATDGERIYLFFGKSGVFAYDFDGKQLWQADVGSGLNGWGSAASPVLFGDLVIINASVESTSLVALDKRSGKEVWRASGIRESWNTPLLVTLPDGKVELVVAIFGKILGFDPASGKQLWSCATDIGWYMVPSLCAADGIVYCIGGRTGGALAVRAGGSGDVTKTHRLWTGRKGSNVSSPVLHAGHLYWANDAQGIAYCAEAKTGTILYEERLSGAGQVYASPVLVGDRLIYLSRQGKAFVVAAKPEYQLLATNDFGERSTFNATPAVAGGRLFVRSDRTLYCIGNK